MTSLRGSLEQWGDAHWGTSHGDPGKAESCLTLYMSRSIAVFEYILRCACSVWRAQVAVYSIHLCESKSSSVCSSVGCISTTASLHTTITTTPEHLARTKDILHLLRRLFT